MTRRSLSGSFLRGSLIPLALAASACGYTSNSQDARVPEIKVLSNRADLISGGDALVEIIPPDGVGPEAISVNVNGSNVTGSFARRADGRYLGLLTGMGLGANLVTARFGGDGGERITITNHPRGGPIFSGPPLQPWPCTTNANGLGAPQDAKCNANTVVSYQYKNASSGTFSAYNPASPPADANVARTTTDEGETVRYIVRKERGTLNRGIYDIVFLHDPQNDPEVAPWTPPRGWNNKFVFSYGSGCAPGYTQNNPEDPMVSVALDRGYAVGVSSLMKFGNSCNHVIAAEITMMIKERLIELLGVDRYSIGNGCSGGAEGQHTVSDNYPGLMDGIRPECTFADGWTPAIHSKGDCAILLNYFTNISPQLWGSQDQQSAVVGANVSHCYEMQALGSGPEDWNPTTGCKLPAAEQYHPVNNPGGARCTLQDLNVNYLGRRAADGFANQVLDYVGIQWGLKAVQDGDILAEQFVDLNEKIGSYNIDWVRVPERTAGDLAGIRRMYETGQLTYAENQKLIPSIDTRTNNSADFHLNVHREVMRNRVLRSVGSIASQVYWLEAAEAPFGLPTPPQQALTLDKLNEWLANIEADPATDTLQAKVARNRPVDVVDGCYDAGQPAPQANCDAIYTKQLLPRMVAGMPGTADILKCQLKPMDRNDLDYADFGVVFSDAQWARLQSAFPGGVCDWSKPGVGQVKPKGYWLDFSGGPDGVPLDSPPSSVAF